MKKIKRNIQMIKHIDSHLELLFKKLSSDSMMGLKRKVHELTREGIICSGVSQEILLNYLNDYVVETIKSIEELFLISQVEFNDSLLEEDLNLYIEKCKKSVNCYFKQVHEALQVNLNKYLVDKKLAESTELNLNNYNKGNITRLELIYKDLILKNSGKKIDESIKISKRANIISIMSLMATIIGIIVSVLIAIFL